VEIEKTQFKPSAKERKLEKNVKEAVDQLNKSRDEFDFERKKYNNQIKKLKGEVKEMRLHCHGVQKQITRARARENAMRSRLHEAAAKRRVEAQERARIDEKRRVEARERVKLCEKKETRNFEHKISKVKLLAVENLLKKVGAGPSLVRTSKGVYGCVAKSPNIMGRRSTTIAAGIVHYSTEPKMTTRERKEFSKISGVSLPSINNMTHLIQEHLSSSIRR
jgi:predicted RNase H-like nuclease (RuvC/YqgF family)